MKPSPQPRRRTLLLLATLSLLIVGCVDDMPIVLRDRLAMESEKLDMIQHVFDAQSAKVYTKGWEKRFREQNEKLSERQTKVEDGLQNTSKKVMKEWQDHYKYMKDCIETKKAPEEGHGTPPLPQPYYFYTKEMVALKLAYDREKDRLQKLLNEVTANPGDQGPDLGELRALVDTLSGVKK